ncbi:6,7-dimethyl-8-ribityllumazine synthase [Wolffia australiana]
MPSLLLLPCTSSSFVTVRRADRGFHPLLRHPFPGYLGFRLLPGKHLHLRGTGFSSNAKRETLVRSFLLEAPVLWAGRLCVFYALLKAGLAGSQSSPLISSGGDLGFSEWLEGFKGGKSEEKEAADRRKLVSKWHPTTKGTFKRSYRVPSTAEGKRLLKAIASLLSDDDDFIDATSHKGCQIRRESAHGESVCCNNVRALFDELPTPHLVLEITPFPVGPLTEKDYAKAEKLEKVLRSGSSI